MSFWKARLLEDAAETLKTPFILDAGADVGAVYNLTGAEAINVSQELYLPYDMVESRLSNFINKFGMVVYLKPGKTYESLDGRSRDFENSLYLESGKSYEPFASYIVDCDTIYATEKPKEIQDKDIEDFNRDIKIVREAIEAEPVRHGEWVLVDATSYADVYTCSECGGFAPSGFVKSNYCQNCGAKMDGKEKEE